MGTVRVACSNGATVEVPAGQDDVRRECDQFLRVFANIGYIDRGPAMSIRSCGHRSNPILAAPDGTPQRKPEIPYRLRRTHEHADTPHLLGLLPPRRERPCRRRATEKRDELASLHSITVSARASSVGGTVMSSVLAVLRLITSSKLTGC